MIGKILLGSTDILVSRIGLGTVKFGRNEKVNYPEKFLLPDDKTILELLALAKNLGINLLDTAPAYGSSEERLGSLLKGQRQDWILSTKVGEEFENGHSYFDFSPTAVQASVQRSLKRLGTDYLDIVLVHSSGEDKKIIEQDQVFETLKEIKKAGLIRAYGMSTKTVEGGLLAIDQSDLVMVTHNLQYDAERSVIQYASQKQKGVFIKKALASGHFSADTSTDPVSDAMKFIFNEPGVSSVIIGTLNPEHLSHNVFCAEQALL
ncbi:MAG: aldo/keto reductase [Gammaproteobacteria bacterium]|nr:aldo/keto reductase [Gammaproteobacteria bacterium]